MNGTTAGCVLRAGVVLASISSLALGTEPARGGKLSVAVTEPDIEPIVMAVGGSQVDTFSLFKGCILRRDLDVEPAAKGRLANAHAVVWTGFFNESGAIHQSLEGAKGRDVPPPWIDVSKGAARVNIPTSTCFGYVDAAGMSGDPFFWLNPRNGSVIARNVADGLSRLRPEMRAYFRANADAFKTSLDRDIQRWKQQLEPLSSLRVFSTQCGWQNFSRLGLSAFVVCKGTPGQLPTPNLLLEQVKQMKAQVILLDPNTPPEYGRAFREAPGLVVIEVPSSVEHIPGARSYSALFENLVRSLLKSAGTQAGGEG